MTPFPGTLLHLTHQSCHIQLMIHSGKSSNTLATDLLHHNSAVLRYTIFSINNNNNNTNCSFNMAKTSAQPYKHIIDAYVYNHIQTNSLS